MEAIMKPSVFVLFVSALLFLLAPSAHAVGDKVDAYFGYSRVGANLYNPYTPGMNGWQFAMHVKPMPFIGFEGDVSRYGANVGVGSQHVTLVMFGPRATAHAAGFSVFAHALGGLGHVSANPVYGLPPISYTAASYALGAGGDFPLLLGLKLRVTGDYLGNSKAPPDQYSPSHFRMGVGVAYHF
jgi:hypothetical protein